MVTVAEATAAGSGPSPHPLEVTVIVRTAGFRTLNLRELWKFRELVYFLTWRDIKVRYKQTVLGVGWAVIQPVVNMIIFTLLFSHLAHLPSGGIPYPLLTYSALVPWTYFAFVLQQSGNSLLINANMISKIYFPRLIIPISTILVGLVDFSLAFVVLLGLMAYFGVVPGIGIVFLPFFVLMAAATAFGVGLWMAVLNITYRDVRYLLPLLTQVWMFASPVAYSGHLITGKLGLIYALNPMAGVIEGFRWGLLRSAAAPDVSILPSLAVLALILVSGLWFFLKMEDTFADVI